jgi:hypothetical protein
MALFGLEPEEKKSKKLFCNKWELEEAVGKCLDISFQDDKLFPILIAELYAHAFIQGNETLFKFLEDRFNANVIQDKEVHIHFDVVNSREEAHA